MTDSNDVIEGGIAVLSSGTDDEGQTTVNGIALGENDITQGMAEKRTLWPGDVLEAAADGLAGKPLVRNHPGVEKTDDGVRLDPKPPIEEVVGEVTDSRYEEGVGILFQADVDDATIAEQIDRGRAEVSPVVGRQLGEFDDDLDAHPVEQITGFRDLGVVVDGASPSNSIQMGAATAMMADALSAAFGSDGDESSGDEPAESGTGNGGQSPDMDLTDKEKELIRQARATDDPVVVGSEDEETIKEYKQLDDPEIVEAEQVEALSEQVEGVRSVMADALVDRTGLGEETVASLGFDALMSEFSDDEGNLEADALVQSPEAGDPSDPDDGGDGDGGGDGDLDDDARGRIEEINEKLSYVGGSLPADRVEALREEACDLADTDDFDAALEVV